MQYRRTDRLCTATYICVLCFQYFDEKIFWQGRYRLTMVVLAEQSIQTYTGEPCHPCSDPLSRSSSADVRSFAQTYGGAQKLARNVTTRQTPSLDIECAGGTLRAVSRNRSTPPGVWSIPDVLSNLELSPRASLDVP